MASTQSHPTLGTSSASAEVTRRLRPRGWLLVWAVGIGGLMLSVLSFGLLSLWEHRLAEAQFQLDAERRVEAIQRAMADRLTVMRALAAFYAGSQLVERDEFHTFTQPLLAEQTGIQALGWIPGAVAEKQDGRFPVSFVEPEEPNRALLGFDLGANPACLHAFLRASKTGNMAAARMILPGGEAADPPGLFVMAPIAGRDPLEQDTGQGPASPEGFVFGVFQIGAAVEDALDYYTPAGINIWLFDESSPGKAAELYAHVSRLPQSTAPSPLPNEPSTSIRHSGHFAVADRLWTILCTPTDEYLARHMSWGPFGILVAGSLLTGLLVGYMALLTGRAARIEKVVAARTAELRLISNAALDPLVMMDSDGNVAHWNPAAERVFGYRRDEIMGCQVHTVLVPERYQERAEQQMREFVRHGRGPTIGKILELEAVRKDGTEFPIEISVSSICLEDGFWAVAIIRDVTARRRAEEAVKNERRLLCELLNLQERERKLVAYDIHDGLAQQLTGALFKFQAFRRQWSEGSSQAGDPEGTHTMFEAAMELLGESLGEARRLISGLRPPILDEFGIVAAIDYLICEHQERGGPEIEFAHQVDFHRVAPPLETAVFRIVQESLTNACRYSQSKRIRVELLQRDNRVHLEVQDWGVGFDPSTVVESHLGLQGIRERARLLGGQASVETALGKGTRITVELPLLEYTHQEPELQPH